VALLEGDLPEEVGELASPVNRLLTRFGVPASLFLLYIEESGIALPVPGDGYVLYLPSRARSLVAWHGRRAKRRLARLRASR